MLDASRLSLSLIIGSRAGLSISLETWTDRPPDAKAELAAIPRRPRSNPPQPVLCQTEFWITPPTAIVATVRARWRRINPYPRPP